MSVRVLMYTRVDPADGGGVQAVFRRLADFLRSQGHTVQVAWRLPDPLGAAGDATCPLPLLAWRGRWPAPRSVLRSSAAAFRLARALFRLRPDVVNVHYVTAESAYFMLLRRLFGYKVVLSVHGSDVLHAKPWDAAVLPRVLSRADAITTVSLLTAARVRESPGVDASRLRVIANGVDLAFWSTRTSTVPLSERPPRVLAAGRLKHVKGHDILLRAFAIVRSRVPETRLVLAGDGERRKDLEALAAALGIRNAVDFTGHVGANEVRARMGECRCFVLPSRSEGLPLALLEAMASGLPCVAATVGGVPEVLIPGTGLLVPPEDPGAMAEALVELLLDPTLAAETARKGAARAGQFAAAAADAAYEALLRELVDGRPAAANAGSPAESALHRSA